MVNRTAAVRLSGSQAGLKALAVHRAGGRA
jgi:hypothetical protein